MGRLVLLRRLVAKDLRHRPVQALLLLVAIAAGATTLTLGLVLRGATDDPYARTRAATNGPDVVATLLPGRARSVAPAGLAQFTALEHAPGVAAGSGPFPVLWALLHWKNATDGAEVEGRGTGPDGSAGSSGSAAVDRPKLLEGGWVRPGGVVVEGGFADALGVHVGDRLNLGGRDLQVVGVAVTAAVPDYPQVCAFTCVLTIGRYNPGLIWATTDDAARIADAATSSRVSYNLNLKLTDPSSAGAFARNANFRSAAGPVAFLYTSQYVRSADARVLVNVQLFLITGSSLLMLLALASVTVLVGGRMAEQTRRVGLLKAVGGTPRLVALVLLCENAVIGLAAAAIGLVLGRLAGPSIAGPGAGLLAAPFSPALDATTIGAVFASALGVAVLSTFVPAVRAARQSTVSTLENAARSPRRHGSVIRLSAHLPAPLLLGARVAARRPRRLLLNLASSAVTVSGLIAVLIMRASEANPELAAPGDPLKARLSAAVVVIALVMSILAAVNALFIAWSTVLDAQHAAALSRALGATPRQVVTGYCLAQLPPSLAGAALGIPGGIGIYYAFTPHGSATTLPSALWFVLTGLATPAAVCLLTAIPTRIGARRPAAQVLSASA